MVEALKAHLKPNRIIVKHLAASVLVLRKMEWKDKAEDKWIHPLAAAASTLQQQWKPNSSISSLQNQ